MLGLGRPGDGQGGRVDGVGREERGLGSGTGRQHAGPGGAGRGVGGDDAPAVLHHLGDDRAVGEGEEGPSGLERRPAAGGVRHEHAPAGARRVDPGEWARRGVGVVGSRPATTSSACPGRPARRVGRCLGWGRPARWCCPCSRPRGETVCLPGRARSSGRGVEPCGVDPPGAGDDEPVVGDERCATADRPEGHGLAGSQVERRVVAAHQGAVGDYSPVHGLGRPVTLDALGAGRGEVQPEADEHGDEGYRGGDDQRPLQPRKPLTCPWCCERHWRAAGSARPGSAVRAGAGPCRHTPPPRRTARSAPSTPHGR